MDAPSGDQTIPRMLTSLCATVDSVPSESQRMIRSLPCCAPSAAVGLFRTKATRLPSGEGTISIPRFDLLHTGLGVPPATGTCHKSSSCGKYTEAPSSFQKAPSTWLTAIDVIALGW